MSDEDTAQFGAGLVYEDSVPISWRDVGKDISTSQILRMHQSNERVLRCFAALEEHRADAADEEFGHVTHELSRVEFKINLLLDMVARMLVEQISIPDPAAVKMNGIGIQWQSHDAPAVGSMLNVEIYLNQAYPSPITLYGEVIQVFPTEGGFLVDLHYRDMSEAVRSWIEKMIFRHHRRQIAHSRNHGRG